KDRLVGSRCNCVGQDRDIISFLDRVGSEVEKSRLPCNKNIRIITTEDIQVCINRFCSNMENDGCVRLGDLVQVRNHVDDGGGRCEGREGTVLGLVRGHCTRVCGGGV